MGRKVRDLKGQFFGHWEVKEYAGIHGTEKVALWKCLCTKCNTEKIITSGTLTRGQSKQCNNCKIKKTPELMKSGRKTKLIVNDLCLAVELNDKQGYKLALKELMTIWRNKNKEVNDVNQ